MIAAVLYFSCITAGDVDVLICLHYSVCSDTMLRYATLSYATCIPVSTSDNRKEPNSASPTH